MKKLSIIVMALALMAGPALAADYDLSADNYSPPAAGQVTVTLAIDNWAGVELKTFDTCLKYDSSVLSVNSMVINDTASGGCAAAAFSITNDNGTDCARLGGGIFPGTTCNVADDYVLATVVFDVISATETTICTGDCLAADDDPCSHNFPEYVEDETGKQYPTEACITINAPIPCFITIDQDPAAIGNNTTLPITATLGGDDCVAPDLVWSDDCVNGSINPSTGVFTSDDFFGMEVCTITVTDNNNTAACTNPGADCESTMTITGAVPCIIEIYEGGYPVPPLNTYSMPGRRGLALTCGDTVQFDYCSNCESEGGVPNCPEWSISVVSGHAPAGTWIGSSTGLLTIGPDCTALDAPATIEVTVTDPCNYDISDTVTVVVGEVILAVEDLTTAPGGEGVQVTVTMANPDHKVKAIQTDIIDADNYLTCTGCAADPDRALEYTCSANDLGDACRIVMTSTNPAGMIEEGEGAILTIDYEVSGSAPSDGCIEISPTDSKVSDRFGCPLCVCEETGEICFQVCGDVYPRECLPDMPNCGDGVIDIFDILEEIDFVLAIVIPSDCQLTRADVPIGTPPYCGCVGDEVCLTDGVIDIFDVLVIIDAALGKANCCDYCATGQIY